MELIYHYPPELLQLLVDTIPLLCRSKKDVLLFFRGAGVPSSTLSDLENRVRVDKDSITKFEIVRVTLVRLNELGERSLRERREVVRRVTEFEDFSTCWPDDQLKAKGLVSEIRRVVDVKDSFTRMRQEREKEVRSRQAEYQQKIQAIQERKAKLTVAKQALYAVFAQANASVRGVEFERAINGLFAASGILVKESFRTIGDKGEGVIEQVDGVISLDGELYLVEVKWLSRTVSVDDVSRHLVRTYHRGSSRALFISASEFSPGALKICTEALQQTVVVLCLLDEIVRCLENETDLGRLLLDKAKHAVVAREPFKRFG